MRSLETENTKPPIEPLSVGLELLANLIYLSRHSGAHSPQQHRYLDWAAKVVEEMQHHPKVYE